MRLFTIAIINLFLFTSISAQVKKIIHQSFEIEKLDNIKLDLVGDYEVIEWAGNSILIETNIELYSASRDIYNALKEVGRYEVIADTSTNLIQLSAFDKERKPIRTKKGECFEIIRVRVLVPEDFDIIDKNTLVRTEPSAKEEEDQ